MKRITLPSMAGGAVPTMDAAAVSSGLAFLESELEKQDPKLREPLTSTTYARDITINAGGGWIEATSNFNVNYAAVGGGTDGSVGGVQNAIRRIQADVTKDLWPVLPYEIAMSVKFIDVQRGTVTGRSIEKMYDDGVRLDFDKYMDANTYVGLPKYGTKGLVNQENVAAVSVATGKAGKTDWANKTIDEILEDINRTILDAWANSGYDKRAIPNHILIPPQQYAYLVKTPFSIAGANGSISLLEYLKSNNIAKDKGVDLFIGECRWCAGSGVGGTDRMVAYVHDDYFVDMDMPVQLQRVMTQPVVGTASYDSLYAANVGVVKVHYFEPFSYRDGI